MKAKKSAIKIVAVDKASVVPVIVIGEPVITATVVGCEKTAEPTIACVLV